MIINNNISVLPFYTNINEQNHRKSYAYGAVYPLFSQAQMLLPFQVIRTHSDLPVTQIFLCQRDGTHILSLFTSMTEAGLQVKSFASLGYDVILYHANFPLSYGITPQGNRETLTMQDGQYMLEMTDGQHIWYSEIFTVVQDMSSYLKIEWYNDDNLVFDGGQFVFDNPQFHNYLYFATEVGKPEYTFEEEGESRDGFFFPEKQISEKRYRCTILAPEYLCDVMRLIRMCDHVRVTDKYGRIYDCDQFLITPEWQDQGDLASVEIEFETNTVVKKIGSGRFVAQHGDFNEDYNDDYLIETT